MLLAVVEFLASCKFTLLLPVLLPAYLLYKFLFEGVVPQGPPWAGTQQTGAVAQLRSSIYSIFSLRRRLLHEYSKNRPFLISSFLNGPMLIVTRAHIPWYKTLVAGGIIDFGKLQKDRLHLQYSAVGFFDVAISEYLNILHRLLAKHRLSGFADLQDEAERTLDATLSMLSADDDGWTEVPCFALMESLTSSSSSRVLLGAPLCRDEQYLSSGRMSYKLIMVNAIILTVTPKILQPVVGFGLSLVNKSCGRTVEKHIRPMLQRLIEGAEDDEIIEGRTLLATFVEEVKKLPKSKGLLKIEALQTLVAVITTAALATTSTVLTDALLNVVSCLEYDSLVSSIREEASLIRSADGITPDALDTMSITDSICRETLRLDNGDIFFARGVVTSPTTTPEGIYLPPGTTVALPLYGIHRDPEIYPERPHEFAPYRFCPESQERRMLAHQVSDQYLAFSLGTHACPGRWFGIGQMKIVLALLFDKYDIVALPQRPRTRHLGGWSVPPLNATIRLRKRREKQG